MPADGMETEREGGDPQSGGGEPASAQIADDDAHARHAMELSQHARRARIVEVVQRLRAHDHVDGPIGEGERGRVASNRAPRARGSRRRAFRHVDRDE
jgi:hypothetical protein